MTVKSYRDLVTWQKAMDLVEMVYRLTQEFPRQEIYGLTSQLRRSAVSVPSNIAEGQGRFSTREFINFLSISNGSLNEAETQFLIAERLDYINAEQTQPALALSSEVGRLVHGLAKSLDPG